jgi:hypothetical protein
MISTSTRRGLLIASLCLILSACASTAVAPPSGCDGRHRRPANPNGSVLASPPEAKAAQAPVTGGDLHVPCAAL